MKNKFYKLLSIMLAVMIVVSGFAGALSVSAEDAVTYYISAAGDDANAGTEAAPLKTLNGAYVKAVADAEAGGYNTADSTVYFKVLGTDAIVSDTKGVAHNFKLIITSAAAEGGAKMAAGQSKQTVFAGPTTLTKITLEGDYWSEIYAEGKDFIVSDDASLKFNSRYAFFTPSCTVTSVTEPMNFVFTSDHYQYADYFTFGGNSSTTFDADFNFTFNAPRLSQKILMDSGNKNRVNTFNKNLNINLVAAGESGVTFGLRDAATSGKIVFGTNAALQIINSTGVAHQFVDGVEAMLTANKFIITNNTGIKNALAFTETAGTYAVANLPEGKVLKATAADGTEVLSEGATLTLTAGEYTVELADEVKPEPKQVTYYLSAVTGDNANAGTEAAPFKTIGGALTAAVAAANAGGYNNAESVVTFKILEAYANNDANMVSYHDADRIDFDFKLVIASNTEGQAAITQSVAAVNFGGDIELQNIAMHIMTWGEPYFGGHDFVMDDNCTMMLPNNGASLVTFGPSKAAGAATVTEDQDVKIVNKSSRNIGYFTLGGGSNTVYDADINLTLDAPTPSQLISFGTVSSSASVTYNKNVNIDLRACAAPSFSRKNTVKYGENAAIQIINSTGVEATYDANLTADFFGETPAVDAYVINNNTGNADFIAFTETAGTYTVAEIPENYVLMVAPKGGEAYTAEGTTLTLAAGEYTLTLVDNSAKPQDVTYYVSASGSNDNDGSEAAPFQTIGGALTAAVAAADAGKYNMAESVVNLKILDTTPVVYEDAKNIAFAFKLNICSDIEGAVLDNGSTAGNTNFCGTVSLENVKVNANQANTAGEQLYLMGNDFTVGEGASFELTQANYPQMIFCTGLTNAAGTVDKAQNIVFVNNGKNRVGYFVLGGGKTTTYNADLNLVYSAPNVNQEIKFDTVSSSATVKYNKNVNFNFKEAGGIKFIGRATPRFTFGADSAVQIINSTGRAVTYDDCMQAALFGDAAVTKTYIINNYTGDSDVLAFTETAGVYTVKEGAKITVIASDKSTVAPVDGVLTLPAAGEYRVITEVVAEPSTNNYSEYINKRDGLKNVALKLKNKEDINVVYFGGSVTGGSGAAAPDVDSWRGKVSGWLTKNFPVSTVENINLAIGGTGTLLGAYRVDAEVLPTQPDLVFVEFAINDRYNGASTDNAKKRFETIIRKIRTAYPDCDIVTLLVTDNSTMADDLKDTLFSQAQAHEDIAAAYNIPSIYIGRALSDVVGTSDNWSNYYADSVHPNEAGYAVHFEVIKEFLNNELNYGNYEGEVTDHTMPAQVSADLIDGDVKLIKVDQAFIDASNAKGGYGFDYNAKINQYGGNKAYNAFVGAGENIDTTSDGNVYSGPGKLVFEFTGTELGVLSMGMNNVGYSVKIDGGEAKTIKLSGNFVPYILATGLESGTHTVELVPIFSDKVGTRVDWIYAFFSSDATKSTHNHAYGDYVSNGDATCTQDGTKSATCSVCGAKDTVADVGSSGHSFAEYVSNNDATCTADGTKTAKCAKCDATDTIADAGSKLGHSFTNYASNNDATCTADGTKTAKCDRCDVTDTTADAGSKLGHSFTNYASDNNATCTADGTKTAKCDRCDATDTVTDAGTAGHKYDDANDMDCNVCGELLIGLEPTLVKDAETGVWYYYVDGKKSNDTTLVKYQGKWFYVENGVWNKTAKTLVKYNGVWFYVANGKWDSTTTDLIKYEGVYFYIQNGKWNNKAETLFKKNGKWFAIKSGKWYKGENLISYSGKKFYVNKGFAQLNVSGKKKIGSKTYTIKNGKVK